MTHCAVMGGWFGMSFFPPNPVLSLNLTGSHSLLRSARSLLTCRSLPPLPASGQGLLCLSALGYRKVNCSEPPRCGTKPSLFSSSVESPLGESSLFSVKYHTDRPGLALQTRLKLICLLRDEWEASRESLQNLNC